MLFRSVASPAHAKWPVPPREPASSALTSPAQRTSQPLLENWSAPPRVPASHAHAKLPAHRMVSSVHDCRIRTLSFEVSGDTEKVSGGGLQASPDTGSSRYKEAGSLSHHPGRVPATFKLSEVPTDSKQGRRQGGAPRRREGRPKSHQRTEGPYERTIDVKHISRPQRGRPGGG